MHTVLDVKYFDSNTDVYFLANSDSDIVRKNFVHGTSDSS